MLKNIAKLECQIGEKIYQLLCDNDSPLAHLKEVLFQFQKYVGQLEDQMNAQLEAAKKEEVVEPEVVVEDSKIELL